MSVGPSHKEISNEEGELVIGDGDIVVGDVNRAAEDKNIGKSEKTARAVFVLQVYSSHGKQLGSFQTR